ncbi:cutinase family protein [Nocardia miyunensis]|uniref:cutinase family protein n=1 Tax=Nocardia miyunensis TaxID=282684 RepID=UPI001FDF518F|nr:cutinase family protein [Nocardia miyunensis]
MRNSARVPVKQARAWWVRVMVAGAVPVVIVLASTDVASGMGAGPIAGQPGVTTGMQPGTHTPAPPPAPAAYPEQPASVRNGAVPRPEPSSAPVPAVMVADLHPPRPVPPVAPIAPPPDTIRIGQFEVPSPPWLPGQVRDAINNTAAGAEAQVSTALDSIGVPAGRSDRVAGATAAGAGIGGAIGGAITAAPAAAVGAVVGGLVGGTVGGIAGAAVGTLVAVPVIGTVTSGVAGTAIGAAAGAAAGALIAGAPAAIAGGGCGWGRWCGIRWRGGSGPAVRVSGFRQVTAALLVCLGVSIACVPGSAGAAQVPIGPGCPRLFVLGVQGTGQSSPTASATADTSVLGALLGPVVAAAPGLVQRAYVAFPAGFGGIVPGGSGDSYTVSVRAAIASLRSDMVQVGSTCHGTELALVGYSAGAEAVAQVSRDIGAGRGPVPASRVAAVVLLANPERRANSPLFPGGRPGQSVPDPAPGTSGAAVSRVRITAPGPSGGGIADDGAQYGDLARRVADICADGDVACAGPERAAVLRFGAELAAQARLSDPLTAISSLQQLLSQTLGNAWTTVLDNDVRVSPDTVDYAPRAPLAQRLIDAGDPRVPSLTPAQAHLAADRWAQIAATLTAHPAELPKLAGQLAGALGQLLADDADLLNPAVWVHFATTVARHDSYAASGQIPALIAWMVALAHDLTEGHR